MGSARWTLNGKVLKTVELVTRQASLELPWYSRMAEHIGRIAGSAWAVLPDVDLTGWWSRSWLAGGIDYTLVLLGVVAPSEATEIHIETAPLDRMRADMGAGVVPPDFVCDLALGQLRALRARHGGEGGGSRHASARAVRLDQRDQPRHGAVLATPRALDEIRDVPPTHRTPSLRSVSPPEFE